MAKPDCSKLIKFVKRHWGHQEVFVVPLDGKKSEYHNSDELDEKWTFDKRCPRCRFDRMSKEVKR